MRGVALADAEREAGLVRLRGGMPRPTTKRSSSRAIVAACGVGVIVLGAALWATVATSPIGRDADPSPPSARERRAVAERASEADERASAPKPPPPDPQPEALADAIRHWKPKMTDTRDDFSPGTYALAGWSVERLRWKDLNAIGETTAAVAKKDPDEARGRLLCSTGSVVQIQAASTKRGKIYEGILFLDGAHPLRFVAVGSTGTLVEHSWARFCGIVTGLSSYKNTGGGTTHAVVAVGMFDLEENRSKGAPRQVPPVDRSPPQIVAPLVPPTVGGKPRCHPCEAPNCPDQRDAPGCEW